MDNRLIEIMEKDTRIIAGMMSGTSVDGVDVAVVELAGHGRGLRYRVLGTHIYSFPKHVRRWIIDLTERNCCIDSVCIGNFLVGDVFSRAFMEAIESIGISLRDIDAIASHGQTIYHIPEYVELHGHRYRCTLQLGSPQIIAEKTGVATVGDFRIRDVAAGGHGAPIIAYVDYAILSDDTKNRVIQNIGGIANVTVVPKSPRLEDIYAFDTGPGNMVINEAVKILTNGSMDYDPNGEIASRGSVDTELLRELMEHPYISRHPPKTTGREMFGSGFTRRVVEKALRKSLAPEDIVATLTMFVVKSIIVNYELFILPKLSVDEAVIGGGGARNRTLMHWLGEELRSRGIRLVLHEDLGIDSKFKEALGMAILGHESLSLLPNNVPGATGARRNVVLGVIAPP